MFNQVITPRIRKVIIIGLALFLILFLFAEDGYSAYRVSRPIILTGGKIYQYYLWGEGATINGVFRIHKGIDFIYGTGTHVYAIASGIVVDFKENFAPGERTSVWGNTYLSVMINSIMTKSPMLTLMFILCIYI